MNTITRWGVPTHKQLLELAATPEVRATIAALPFTGRFELADDYSLHGWGEITEEDLEEFFDRLDTEA